jgi:single-strand DNA-binding protein
MINKAILVGRVGGTPQVKEFQDGGKVAQFSLATSEPGFTTRDGKQIPERTEWHNVVIRGGLVKVVENYVEVGQQLYIEGKIRTRSYEQDGVKKYVTEILCDTLKMLGHKPNRRQEGQQENPAPSQENTGEHQPEDDFPF